MKTVGPQTTREWLVARPQNPLSNSHDGAHTPLVSKVASVAYAVATAARLEKRWRMGSHNLTAM
jgi:hypothetical protein